MVFASGDDDHDCHYDLNVSTFCTNQIGQQPETSQDVVLCNTVISCCESGSQWLESLHLLALLQGQGCWVWIHHVFPMPTWGCRKIHWRSNSSHGIVPYGHHTEDIELFLPMIHIADMLHRYFCCPFPTSYSVLFQFSYPPWMNSLIPDHGMKENSHGFLDSKSNPGIG